MPPWQPDHGVVQFANERRLSDAEIALLTAWAKAGAPEGDPAQLPPAPSFPGGWQLGTPDLVVTLPDYPVPQQGHELYRNFVARIPVTEPHYVNAVEIRTGNPRVVHHARMMVDTTDSSRKLAAQDSLPGFNGMMLSSNATIPDGFFIGWTPGKVPTRGPEDMAWHLAPGTDLVLQLHLRPRGEPEVVHPQVGFYFAKRPPTRIPTLIMLGSKTLDIPPGEAHYVVVDSFRLPVDVAALDVYPHAHYLATEMQGFARLPNGHIRWLLHIKDWDFNWQDEYRYQRPIPLPKGSTVIMRYNYDNSTANPQNPNHPPKRVTYGPNSTDEMCDFVVQIVPARPGDLALLNRELAWKYTADDEAWYAGRELAAGQLSALEGDAASAMRHYGIALDNRVTAAVHAAMADALASQDDFAQALLHARAALTREPAAPAALAAMARVLAQDPDTAVRDRQQALRLARQAEQNSDGLDAATTGLLAGAFAALDERDAARRLLERALGLAQRAGNVELQAALQQRLRAYAAEQPPRPQR
jgi:tetratricopeptide (TPR) repeat protein